MTNENALSTAISVLFENEMTEKGLIELRVKYPADIVHDMSDPDQLKAARKVRTEKNKLVENIKTRRINVTSDIKVKADELTGEVELIYATVVGPFEKQLEINKLAKEKEERELKELLDGQREEISELNKFVTDSIGKASSHISGVVESVDLIDTSFFHKDIIHEAIETKANVLSRLGELLSQALNEEALQVQREALDKQQEEAAAAQAIVDSKAKAQERLNNLMMIPAGFYGKSSEEINDKIKSLENYNVLESQFGELFDQACQCKTQVISQLGIMGDQQIKVENAAFADELLAEGLQQEQELKQQEKVIEDAVATGDNAYQEPVKEPTAETLPTLPNELIIELCLWCDCFGVSTLAGLELKKLIARFI